MHAVLYDFKNTQSLVLPQLLQLVLSDAFTPLLLADLFANSKVWVVVRVVVLQQVLDLFVEYRRTLLFPLPLIYSHPQYFFEPTVSQHVVKKTNTQGDNR